MTSASRSAMPCCRRPAPSSTTASAPRRCIIARSAGRRILAAAKSADRKLGKVARSFDFLLSVSPINTGEAMERFLAAKAEEMPHFRYRPLAVDPDNAKRALYDIDLSILEDPLLERLLTEKRREIDQQLTMLATRNTAVIPPGLDDALRDRRDRACSTMRSACCGSTDKAPPRGESIGAGEVAIAATRR